MNLFLIKNTFSSLEAYVGTTSADAASVTRLDSDMPVFPPK